MSLGVIFLIPCLIVGFWKSRPVWAFCIATLVLAVTFTIPILLQFMVLRNTADPQFAQDLIRYSVSGAVLAVIVCAPLVWLFQWFVLRRHRRTPPKVDAEKTFS